MANTLEELALVDSPASEDFDRFTRLATNFLGVPVALVSIVDFANDRQFFASATGLPEPWASKRETPLTHSFCQHVVAQGKPLVVEDARMHPLVCDNLAIRDLNVIAYLGLPVTAPDGRNLGALCAIDSQPRAWTDDDIAVLKDLAASVTSQIGLRAALLVSENTKKDALRLGRVVENAHHEVFMFEPGTLRFTDANKGARRNLGYNIGELRALTPVDIKPEFDQQQFEAFIAPLVRGEIPNRKFETIHERKDGGTYPVSIRLEYHGHKDDVFIAFVEDITERRKLEVALAEETENFLALFNNAPEPMAVSGLDKTVLHVNSAFEHLFDTSFDSPDGLQLIDLIPEKYRNAVQEGFANVTPEEPRFSVLMEQTLNGSPRILIWSNLVLFEEGRPTKAFSIASDVTELHDAKTRAEDSAEEARKAMEVRKTFLANMSHEVRTPLNAIMGLFQLIEMADVPQRQKKQAEVGLAASHQLLSQLVNVLELSRVEADAVEIKPAPTDIRSLAQQWMETAAATNHRLGKPIELMLDVAENTPHTTQLDARRVTQILNNLMDNAIKFTDEGQVAIHVKPVTGPEPSTPEHLEISVSDTGCGIARDQRESVFERFVQIDDAQTRENGGSGLGLAISREIAELMGAKLDVTCPSADDCYATKFSLKLQIVR